MKKCSCTVYLYGPRSEKTCLRGFANNKGADQSAHSRRLISTFIICFLESIIYKLVTSEISFFEPVSVAEETDLSPALSETLKRHSGSYGVNFSNVIK